MPIDLDQPLSWKKADSEEMAMLNDLQGNILKAHGRNHAAHLFLQFENQQKARQFVRALGGMVKSALQQLKDAETFRTERKSAGRFISFFLSAQGYQALGFAADGLLLKQMDKAFQDGRQVHQAMSNNLSGETVNRPAQVDDVSKITRQAPPATPANPPAETGNQHFKKTIHAMILIADDSPQAVMEGVIDISKLIPVDSEGRLVGVRILGLDTGKVNRKEGKPIEHFGYVDGISVPVMLQEDMPEPGDRWSPEGRLRQVLVEDPGGTSEFSYGSYVVFHKLEQHTEAFRTAMQQLAADLDLGEGDAERAGAMVIGRFTDGTPLVLYSRPGAPDNNFDFADDPNGRRCPFHAHIRKMNPRGESELPDERDLRIVRRGMTYGEYAGDPLLREEGAPPPAGKVGLLFMSYQSSIVDKFKFIQQNWANDPNFRRERTGPDPITAKQADVVYRWPVHWGEDASPTEAAFSVDDFITFKGGEYFFAPSISFLTSGPSASEDLTLS